MTADVTAATPLDRAPPLPPSPSTVVYGEGSPAKGGRVGWAKHPYRRWRATSPETGRNGGGEKVPCALRHFFPSPPAGREGGRKRDGLGLQLPDVFCQSYCGLYPRTRFAF